MLNFSTGLRNQLVNSSGLGSLMNSGCIYLYSEPMAETADAAVTGTLLARITTEGRTYVPENDTVGAGLRLTLAPPGGLTKTGIWTLKGVAIGTAYWWRWCSRGYDGFGYSETRCRMDGRVGESLILLSNDITPLTEFEVETFLFTLKAAN
jgi:hypothetical protein